MDSYKTFVKEIAERDPIVPTYSETNECQFCRTSWAEENYATYRKNDQLIRANPVKKFDGTNPDFKLRRLHWHHHDADCLWVIANELMERNSED